MLKNLFIIIEKWTVVLTILVVLPATLLYYIFRDRDCLYYEDIKNMEVIGIVKDKGFPKKSHNAPTVWVITQDSKIQEFYFGVMLRPVYDTLSKGDYIVKNRNSVVFTINNKAFHFFEKLSSKCQ